ncbi:ATP-dependent Clp protease adapter ClpS [Georgenia sp. 10Sc9-8]|uniref:ATP-dependent Clp protease adapter protein ClpS n=1 Tax=Georgenia halotolerans TaxID=3028317 RepID=A0ABT5TYU3_9MICO|nr:ATP-dependent Clp protease adapter ClpS [Georgenia halotolerans]
MLRAPTTDRAGSAVPAEQAEQAEQATSAPEAVPERGWRTVVWNDPVNLMSYVTYVFRTYFGHPEAVARRLMLQVHREGRAVVSRGPREQMEVDVAAMHSYGLWATVEQED